MVRNIKNTKGFTLIELLVVVAIIGILATAGIPQYRRMVAKSRQTEAKVALGEVATAESAFFSEYGAYGNNLRLMGVQSDIADPAGLINANQVASKTYMYGFFSGACAALGGAPVPTNPGVIGTNVANNLPNYYVVGVGGYDDTRRVAPAADSSSTFFGRVSRNTQCGGIAAVAPAPADAPVAYQAIASGVIRTGADKDNPLNANDNDVWSVNEARIISNVQSAF